MNSPVSDPDAARDDRRRPTTNPENGGSTFRPLGVGTRNVIEGLLGLPVALADIAAYPVNRLYETLGPAPSDPAGGQRRQPLIRSQREVVGEILDRLGLPRPETAQERVVGRVIEELAGAASMYGLGGTLARGAGEIIPAVGQTLTTAPGAQATGAIGAGLAGGLAHEVAPDSAAAELAASLAGGLLGGALPLVLARGGAGDAAAAMARSAGHRQDAAAGIATRQAAQPEGAAAFVHPTAANDIAPLPRASGGIVERASVEPPADAATPRISTGEPTGSIPSPQMPTTSLSTPAIITASSGTNAQRRAAQGAARTLLRPWPTTIIEPVPAWALPQAERDREIVQRYLAEWMATPPHQRPPLPDHPAALLQPSPRDTIDVPQIMGRILDATRLDILAPGLRGPHGYRRSGRGDLAVLQPYVEEVVRRLTSSLDPVVVRLARGESVPGATPAQIRAASLAEHYNMQPALESMLDAGLSPQAAMNRLQQEATLLSATSPLTNTRAGQRSAALYGNRLALGLPIDSAAMAAATTPGFNIMYSRHSPLVQRAIDGGWTLSRNSKLLTYRSALAGDRTAVPFDSNKVRNFNMMFNDVAPGVLPRASFATEAGYQRYLAAYRNGRPGMTDNELLEVLARAPGGQRVNGLYVPSELPFYHDILTQVADRLRLSPTQADSLLWFHFGDRTGLASPHMTQIGVLNERLAHAGAALGIPPSEAARRYWRNEIPLPLVAGTAGAGALAALPGTEPEARRGEEM